MNVTKSNFEDVAAEIEVLLPGAAFVAIDEEMTGISIAGQQERVEDVPARRYSKMREVAMRYNIIQFGLAIFTRSEGEAENYTAHTYNFYVFPETGPVNMEGAAVAFNRDHGMDWNVWIREGVPYLTREAAAKLKASLMPEEKAAPRERIVLAKASDIETTGAAVEGLRSWLADETKKSETEFELLTTNAYLRRFMYEALAADFPDLAVESRPTKTRGVSTLVALRLDAEQKAERAAKIRAEKEAELARKVGFSRVFNALAKSKKPLIGHALMFDLLFAFSHFEGRLPESYAKYKELVQSHFPVIFDTQLLAKKEPFKFLPASDADAKREHRFGSHALGEVYKVFLREAEAARTAGTPTVEVSFAPGHDRYGPDCAAFHEAGYDAYVTGYAFAHMAKLAFSQEVKFSLSCRSTMFRALFDFHLAGEDELVATGIYVHVKGLKGQDADSLRSAFAEIKAPSENDESQAADVQIRWIDDDNAFAVLPESCSAAVAAMLQRVKAAGNEEGGFTFTAGEEWFAAQTAAASPCDSKDAEERRPKRARTDQ